MVADNELWAGPVSSRGLKAMGVCGHPHLRSSSCLDLCDTPTELEKMKETSSALIYVRFTASAPGSLDCWGYFLYASLPSSNHLA